MKTAKEHLKNFPLDQVDHVTRELVYTAWENGYVNGMNDGYEEGFQVAQAAERGIIAVQKKIDALKPDLLFEAVKVICDDYNAKILGGCPRKEQRP